MSIDIQKIIDSAKAGSTVHLPMGEFEGPFRIDKPCNVIGTSTTLWTKRETVISIESNNVTVENLRIEVTQKDVNENEYVCLISKFKDTKFKNVEIVGNVIGIPKEEGNCEFPKVLNLGKFPALTVSKFKFEVYFPNSVSVESTIDGIIISPHNLNAGFNQLTVEAEKLKDKTYIYGEILFKSIFLRRMYLNGSVESNLKSYSDNQILYKLKNKNSVQRPNIVYEPSVVVPISSDSNVVILKKGQRTAIKNILKSKIQIVFGFSNLVKPMEIDPYVFLLNHEGKAKNDEDLVFFGNAQYKGVKYVEKENDKIVELDLEKVSDTIKTVAVAYSIYGDNPSNNFSKIISPAVRIISEGKEKFRFLPEDLLVETTIVALEFYRYKDEWKLNTVGSGYRDGLKKLCESYGLTVI